MLKDRLKTLWRRFGLQWQRLVTGAADSATAGAATGPHFKAVWRDFLLSQVTFYQALNVTQRTVFERRVQLFLDTTEIVGNQVDVSDEDRLLIAASAIIPVWSFPQWHYFNLQLVILLPASFNQELITGQADSLIQGMVGTGYMAGKMLLSKPALHQGFANSRDKRNVGVHEFAHLIDMADGDCDGFPERLKAHEYCLPWLDLAKQKMAAIERRKSNIDAYGATNNAEFFAVISEYFFERPGMLKAKHPQLYATLSDFYQQDCAEIALDIKVRKKAPCPCGSGKRYKRCCLPDD